MLLYALTKEITFLPAQFIFKFHMKFGMIVTAREYISYGAKDEIRQLNFWK